MWRVTLIVLSLMALTGCQSSFFRSIDGTSASVGLYLPNESTFNLNVLEYISGEQITVRDKSAIKYTFSTTYTNTYFGIVHINETRKSEIEVVPEKNIENNQ